MHRLFLCLVALISFGSRLYAQSPSYEALHHFFYGRYDISSLDQPYVSFEKHDREWYVTTYAPGNDGTLQRERAYLLFDGQAYRELPDEFRLKTGDAAAWQTPQVDPYEAANFALQRCYGYPGWYKDVVKYSTAHPPGNDSAFYALGRAYSTMANALLSNQFGDALPRETFPLTMRNDCMTPAQIRQYDSVCRLAIGCFRKTEQLTPGFQTLVGTVGVKTANEQVVPFHNLLTYAASSAQNYKLPASLYPDSLLGHYREVLEDCPSGSILLSMGDMDFYTVLYLQQHEGLRKDVYLINFSLMLLDRYLYRYQFPQFSAKGIDLGLDSASYYGQRNSYLTVYDEAVADRQHTLDMQYIRSIVAEGKSSNAVPGGMLTVRKAQGTKKAITGSLSPGYLYKNEWTMLFMLHRLGNRPFCTQYPFQGSLSFLNDHLKQKGAVWLLE